MLTLEQVKTAAPSAFAEHAHATRSERYQFIPTSRVIEGLLNQNYAIVKATQSGARDASKRDFTKHMLRFRPVGIAPVVGDVFPEVVLVNSHDGSSAYNLMAGLFRLACSNGMVAACGDIENVKVRHSGNVVSEVIEGARRILDVANVAANRVKQWNQIELSKNEQLILATAAHSVRFPAQEVETEGEKSASIGDAITPERILTPRRTVDTKNDLWTTLNVIQENVIRGGQRGIIRNGRETRRVRSRAVNGIDQDVKLNQALWKMAEQMAKLKGAA